jgi:DNA-directed RNA polymerase specialized sigma24 family protein
VLRQLKAAPAEHRIILWCPDWSSFVLNKCGGDQKVIRSCYVLLREALEELRTKSRTDPKTVQAFEMLVYHGLAPQVVAEQMGMSTHDVYLAKSRVAAKLREIVLRLEAEYEEAPGDWESSGARPSDGLRG